jgi:hypothetical protein
VRGLCICPLLRLLLHSKEENKNGVGRNGLVISFVGFLRF